jgi:hypothetical protein
MTMKRTHKLLGALAVPMLLLVWGCTSGTSDNVVDDTAEGASEAADEAMDAAQEGVDEMAAAADDTMDEIVETKEEAETLLKEKKQELEDLTEKLKDMPPAAATEAQKTADKLKNEIAALEKKIASMAD